MPALKYSVKGVISYVVVKAKMSVTDKLQHIVLKIDDYFKFAHYYSYFIGSEHGFNPETVDGNQVYFKSHFKTIKI